MDVILYAAVGAFILAFFYIIAIYNRLILLKNSVKKAWSNIDVLLKQRHEELPKLVETCKQYMKHEKETLERITTARSNVAAARSKGDMPALGSAETSLRMGLGQLFALVENYPDLKADQSFQHLQSRISGLESSIADRREYFNDAVNLFNVGIEQFPDLIFARLFNFQSAELLQFDATELADVNMKSLFN